MGVFKEVGVLKKVFISVLVLGVGSMLFSRFPARSGDGWYHNLNQPFFAPAYWIPFVMWTLVYILIGTAFAIIWHRYATVYDDKLRKEAKAAMILFGVHLIFNFINPVLLIGLHWPKVALIDMLILIVFIFLLMKQFKKVDQFASNLLIPYLVWIFYAASLNIAIVVLN